MSLSIKLTFEAAYCVCIGLCRNLLKIIERGNSNQDLIENLIISKICKILTSESS